LENWELVNSSLVAISLKVSLAMPPAYQVSHVAGGSVWWRSIESTRVNCMDGLLQLGRAMSTVGHNYVIIDGMVMRSKAVANCQLVSFKEMSGSEQV